MQSKYMKRFMGLLVISSVAVPAWSHHSGAMFDQSRQIEITGTVTDFAWTNPHSSFRIDVPDANGRATSWAVEMGSPQNLIHEGWKRSSLKAGDKVTVWVVPLRDGKPGGMFISIVLADGTRLGSAPYSAPATASDSGAPGAAEQGTR